MPLVDVPITVTNAQGVDTPAPFQQMIQFNPSLYSFLMGDLSNVRFTDEDYSALPAWLESYSSTSATVWVKLNDGIKAGQSRILHMLIGPVGFDGQFWGEAPELSSTYAEYDSGANVFNAYWNFAGTTLPNGWTSGGTVTINNGVYLSDSSGGSVETTTTFGPSTLDWYGYATVPTISGYWANLGWVNNIDNVEGNDWFVYGGQSNYAYGYLTPSVILYITYTNIAASSSSNHIFTIDNDGTNAHYAIDYVYQSTTYPMQSTSNGIFFKSGAGPSGGGSNIFVQWLRVRAYPPGGVMPGVTVGSPKIYNYGYIVYPW